MDDMEQLIAELTARIDALEETVEELRYAGPSANRPVSPYEDSEYYMDEHGELWDV